jgi:hypothetical protein
MDGWMGGCRAARVEEAGGGGLEVEGDLWLAQALNASLYFIRSSIRADWAHGLSPGGLASTDYGGHTFWGAPLARPVYGCGGRLIMGLIIIRTD